MPWELILIGVVIIITTSVALIAMRRTRKTTEFATFGHSDVAVNTDELANKIAKAIGVELREILKEMPQSTVRYSNKGGRYNLGMADSEAIEMDESIIPTKMNIDVEATNLEGAAKEEKVIDKDLGKSKSKLAGLLKKKRSK